MTGKLEYYTKKELIEEIYKTRRHLVQKMLDERELINTMCKEHKESIEFLNKQIKNLQEKIKTIHTDLATQIHWRMKLEKELMNFGQKTQEQ